MDGSAEDTTTDWRSTLVDVSDMSLTELAGRSAEPDSALAHALRRLADDLTQPGQPIAGFNSAI
ncbi:FxSxx-COOH cyclophane-containing RiPP peptide [Micromonosporaceae bacterium Da 78-11]